jgi:hypothetical protein
MNEPTDSMWVTGYTPDGFKVSLTLLVDNVRDVQYWMNYIRSQGILPREPGIEIGEQTQVIHHVMRFDKIEEDGSETPVICLYHERSEHPTLKAYMNTPDHVRQMEVATGIPLTKLPILPGNSGLKRGANPKLDAQYIVRLPTPITVYWKDNPRYDKSQPQKMKDDKVAQRIFSRWANQPVASPPQAANDSIAQTETKSAAPKYDRAAVLELVTFLYDHPKHASASLNKLLDHTDSEQQEWWIPPSSPTLAAAYGVLLYKAANTPGIEMNREQVLAAMGVERFSEWDNQYLEAGEGLQAAWEKLKAEAVGDF